MAYRAAPALQQAAADREALVVETEKRYHRLPRFAVQQLGIDAMVAHRVAAAGERVGLRVRMNQVQRAALADHGVVVEVLLQPLTELCRMLVEGGVGRRSSQGGRKGARTVPIENSRRPDFRALADGRHRPRGVQRIGDSGLCAFPWRGSRSWDRGGLGSAAAGASPSRMGGERRSSAPDPILQLSSVIPSSRISGPQIAVSLAIRSRSCSLEPGKGSRLTDRKRCAISGFRNARSNSAYNRTTIASDVPLGTTTPCQE